MRPAASSSAGQGDGVGRDRGRTRSSRFIRRPPDSDRARAADRSRRPRRGGLGRQRNLFGFAGADDLPCHGAGVVADLVIPIASHSTPLRRPPIVKSRSEGRPSASSRAPASSTSSPRPSSSGTRLVGGEQPGKDRRRRRRRSQPAPLQLITRSTCSTVSRSWAPGVRRKTRAPRPCGSTETIESGVGSGRPFPSQCLEAVRHLRRHAEPVDVPEPLELVQQVLLLVSFQGLPELPA